MAELRLEEFDEGWLDDWQMRVDAHAQKIVTETQVRAHERRSAVSKVRAGFWSEKLPLKPPLLNTSGFSINGFIPYEYFWMSVTPRDVISSSNFSKASAEPKYSGLHGSS